MSAKIMAFMRQINEGKVETNRAKIFVAIQIEIGGRVFSQWAAHSNIDGIMAHKRDIEEKKKAQWIKRAQNAGWIDNQIAYFLTKHVLDGK